MLLVGQKFNGLNSRSIRSFFSSVYFVCLSITFVVSFDNLLCEVGLNLPIFIFLLSLPDIFLISTTIKPRFHTIFVDLGVPITELMYCIFSSRK